MPIERASDDLFREHGYDPQWIQEDDEREGPYAAIRVFNEACPCCGGTASGWTVINLITAVGAGSARFGDDAECDAQEQAFALNTAWIQGRAYQLERAPR
jgi:hypothetical protein